MATKLPGYRLSKLSSITLTSRYVSPPLLTSMHAKSLQSCPTLCNPVDYSPPVFSDHGFSGEEYWSGFPCPSPGVFPTEGSNLSLMSPASADGFSTNSAHLGSSNVWWVRLMNQSVKPSLCLTQRCTKVQALKSKVMVFSPFSIFIIPACLNLWYGHYLLQRLGCHSFNE